MKKLGIVALVLCMVAVLSGTALAAQAAYIDTTVGKAYYAPTPKVFTADSPENKTNYPYEIYLPNESNPAQYRIHTNYTKNTDACASCHATHTAVGPSLLQWYSVYETCMACHDGTVTTTYNVEDGEIGTSGDPTFGGHFGTGAEHSLSSHNVQGAVQIAAAPGGSVVAETIDVGSGKTVSMWGATFGCESCHTPHGQGGNARILHPDPNGWASSTKKADYNVDKVTGAVYAGANEANVVTLLKGYPYKIVIAGASSDLTTNFTVYNGHGYTVLQPKNDASLNDVVYVRGTASIEVEMEINGYLTDNETVKHKKGINSFCGACHVDYNTENAVATGNGAETIMGDPSKRPGYGALTGKYSQAHRHAVGVAWNYGNAANQDYIGNDKLMMTMGTGTEVISCLTCHFAHGTSEEYWQKWTNKFGLDAKDGWGSSLALKEIAGSSALKRLPNMATCEACHQKGDAAEGYLANTSLTGQYTETVATQDALFVKILGNLSAATYVDEINSPNLCTTQCHKDYAYDDTKDFLKHKQVIDGNDVVCQTCHGPASLHVKAPSAMNIINPNMPFNKMLAVDNVCGTSNCHASVAAEWKESRHAFNAANGAGANCVSCHESHEGQTHNALAMKDGNAQALCTSCHITQTPLIADAIKAINADGSYRYAHTFGYVGGIADESNPTNKAWVGSPWIAQNSKLSTRTIKGLSGSHANLATTVTQTSCWGGTNGCHENNGYADLISSVHFSQSGTTEGYEADFNGYNEPKGMRNRY